MSDAAEHIDVDDEVTGTEEAEAQQPEEAKEPEQEPEKEPEKVEFTPEQQAIFNDAINKKVAKQREAERKAEEAERRAKEIEEQLKAQKEPERPSVPPKPTDPYADDYEKRMDEWAEKVAEQKAYDERVAWQERQLAEQQQAAQQAEYQKYQQKTSEYFERGDKLGISQVELSAASQQINAFNLQQDIVNHLLDDDRGPEMALYLANNLEDMQTVATLPPTKAAVYLETVVKPKSRREPPKVPPKPVETDTGSSVTETDDGITLE